MKSSSQIYLWPDVFMSQADTQTLDFLCEAHGMGLGI